MSRISDIQQALIRENLDGWLLFDFHHRDPLAYRVLKLPMTTMTTRRWFYFIPAEGEPVRLAHAVEKGKLDDLPGKKIVYQAWKQLHRHLEEIVSGYGKIAMNFSPLNHIPYVSLADAGTVELVRSFGPEIHSSANLIQEFEALISPEGLTLHLQASDIIDRIRNEAFQLIESTVKDGEDITEYEVQQYIVRRFGEEGLTCEGDEPIVGVNEHPADPHFMPTTENSYVIKKGDTLLIDLWARHDQPGGIYYDITWCGFVGKEPPDEYVKIFDTVVNARKRAVEFIRERFSTGTNVFGWEVDDACRRVVEEAGYGDYFVHRTGHSIGHEVHGNGVNIDNLETKDERPLVPGVCFSIEPGIYLDGKMAVRTEVDVFITHDGQINVAGEEQHSLILMDL